jgi:hypothetical protein
MGVGQVVRGQGEGQEEKIDFTVTARGADPPLLLTEKKWKAGEGKRIGPGLSGMILQCFSPWHWK